VPNWIQEAVVSGGGQVVPVTEAEGLIWHGGGDAIALGEMLIDAPDLQWVQLPWAGIERYVDLLDADRTWTCGKGVYGRPVAELALSLALAGVRRIGTYARATSWGVPLGESLYGARVTMLGGGGIAQELIKLLTPFDCHITVVRNHARAMEGADDVLEADRYVDALPGADIVVLALPLTPETEQIIGHDELEAMESHTWLINVARGRHVITDELVTALHDGVIGGAALDVTDPEPLPDSHPLWLAPNCILTPHVGGTPQMEAELMAARIVANVKRFRKGEQLLGVVDPQLGY
jgi:phosphoglycerate dehydrogenase-like enzyme